MGARRGGVQDLLLEGMSRCRRLIYFHTKPRRLRR